MNLSACKRVVLFNGGKTSADDEDEDSGKKEKGEGDPNNQVIEFRHYGVSAR